MPKQSCEKVAAYMLRVLFTFFAVLQCENPETIIEVARIFLPRVSDELIGDTIYFEVAAPKKTKPLC